MGTAYTDKGAAYELGMYYYEWGNTQNLFEAIKWFQKSADLGEKNSMFYLGEIYKQQKNNPKALFWYMKAIDANNTIAMNTMAYAYALGQMGLNKDMDAAFDLINRAIVLEEKNSEYIQDFYDSKGEFYSMLNDYKNAKTMWEKVKAVDASYYSKNNSELNKYILKRQGK